MTRRRLTDDELAAEAARWDRREVTPRDWADAPEAVPRRRDSVAISMRMPARMLEVLREFARRRGIGYQVLMKLWLDQRIRAEANALREQVVELQQPSFVRAVASFHPPGDVSIPTPKEANAQS